jgi:hypothetical protein
MALREDVRTRAPRGTKIVAQAFFAALADIAEGQQAAVASAAVNAIRDTLKQRQAKTKLAAAKAKAKTPRKRASAKPARRARKAA